VKTELKELSEILKKNGVMYRYVTCCFSEEFMDLEAELNH